MENGGEVTYYLMQKKIQEGDNTINHKQLDLQRKENITYIKIMSFWIEMKWLDTLFNYSINFRFDI